MKISRAIGLLALMSAIEARPQVPEQVQQFLQQTFFNPILEKVDQGGEAASRVISQITNITLGHAEHNQDGENSGVQANGFPDLSPVGQILSKIKDQEENEESSTDWTTTVSTNLDAEIEQVTIMPTQAPAKNKTRKVNHLDKEASDKMKAMCPELVNATDFEIVRYRYFEPRGACFRYGFQGPCGNGMKLFIKEYGSIYGQCDCRLDSRMWIYHEESFSCYKIFSQGGCSEGNYMDLTEDGKPGCVENPCAANGTEFYKLRGMCAQIGKPNVEICKDNSVIDFIPKKRTPDCIKTQAIVTGVGILPCMPGSVLAVHGKCHVEEWDFGKED